MGDVLNLNRFRKRKKRDDARSRADANAIKHGQSRAERAATRAQQELDEGRLDGAKRSCDPENEAEEAPGDEGDDAPSSPDEPT